MSSDDTRMLSEADAMKAATSAACSQLVQGIQNILNSTAAAASATQAIPGIITPGILPPSTSTPADSLFPALPGMWPSLCGFNPLVPPPGFLATFDPTRPPPSLGSQSAAADDPSAPDGKTTEEEAGVAEDMSDNMDLDESVSSSQGDDQDFLESRVELIQSGSLPSGPSRFAETQQRSGSGWNPGAEYGKQEIKSGVDYLKAPSSESMGSGLEQRSAEEGSSIDNATVETNARAGMSGTDVGPVQGWRDEVRGIPPVISSSAVTGFSFPVSSIPSTLLSQTGPMTVSPGFGPVPQGQSSAAVTFQPLQNQSHGFARGLITSDKSQSGPNVGIMPPVIYSGPGSGVFGPGPGVPVRPGSGFSGPNLLSGGSINASSSGSNGPGHSDSQPFAPNAFAGLSSSWPRGPAGGPNRPPMAHSFSAEGRDGPNVFRAVGPNMPSQGGPRGIVPFGDPNNVDLAKSSDTVVDKERQMHEMGRGGFPEPTDDFPGLQDKDFRQVLGRGGSQVDVNQRLCGPNGMGGGGPFGLPDGPGQIPFRPNRTPFGSDGLNRMPVVSDGPNRMPFVAEGSFRMPFAPDGPNQFPFGTDGLNEVPGGQMPRMPALLEGENQMHFVPNGMSGGMHGGGSNRMPSRPDGPNQLPGGSDGMQGANQMPFGPNRMPNGSDGMPGGPFGMPFGTNRIPFGSNQMPFLPDGQNRISVGPDGMPNRPPFGMPVGPNRMPDPNQTPQMPGVNRLPGQNQMPGGQTLAPPGINQLPTVSERSVNEMLGESNGPRPTHPGMSSFHSEIPHGSQTGLAPGCGGPPGQPFGLNPGIGRVPGPCPGGQGTMPSGSGMMYSSQDAVPPGSASCERPAGYSGGMLPDQGSMHMGQAGMAPGSGRMLGPGMVLGSNGRPDMMSPGGAGLGPNGMPSGLSALPPGVVGRFPGSGGMPRGPAGFPGGPNGMPMFQGGRFPGPGGNSSGQDGMPVGQSGRFPGPGGTPGGQDAQSVGQGGRFPGPSGISGGPDGLSPGACRMPLGSNRPPSSDGILGNPGPDVLGASLNRMPFVFPMVSSSSGGILGVRMGSGDSGIGFPGSSDMMQHQQQQGSTREHRPGPGGDMAPERNCPGESCLHVSSHKSVYPLFCANG